MPKTIDPPPSTATVSAVPRVSVQAEQPDRAAALIDVRRVLFTRKYLILAIVAVAVIVSYIYAKTRIPMYEATATAEIDTSRSESIGLSDLVGSSSESGTTKVQTEAFRITGDSLIFRAVAELASEHEGQLLNYMRIARQPVGYLVNFGHKTTLEWKRFILSEFIAAPGQRPGLRNTMSVN